MVHLRIPKRLYTLCVQIVRENGFGSVQELARESLRKAVSDYENEGAIKRLKALQGSVKNIKRMTKEERDATMKEFLGMSRKERLQLLREYGLDKARKA